MDATVGTLLDPDQPFSEFRRHCAAGHRASAYSLCHKLATALMREAERADNSAEVYGLCEVVDLLVKLRTGRYRYVPRSARNFANPSWGSR